MCGHITRYIHGDMLDVHFLLKESEGAPPFGAWVSRLVQFLSCLIGF
jgi:hypothetical protein